MAARKIIPFAEQGDARERIVRAVGPVLAERGFARFSAECVARHAEVGKGLVYKLFGSLENLVRAYAAHPDFWPSVEELTGPPEALRGLSPGAQVAAVFRNYVEALRVRPHTRGIIAREMTERTAHTEILEAVRERRSLEVFEAIQGDFPENVDLSAVVAVMAGAFLYIAMRSHITNSFGGVDLRSEQGWQRIGETLDILIKRTLEG